MYPYLFRKILLPFYGKLRNNKLPYFLNEYERHSHWDIDKIKTHQWECLHSLIKHAYETTTFYPKLWKSVGIDSINDIQTMDDFLVLPTITKQDITENYNGLLSSKFSNNIKKSTGGSTGIPFHFEYNKESNDRREAVMWRGYEWAGYKLGMKTTYLWSVSIGDYSKVKKLKEKLFHQFYNRSMLNLFELKESNIPEYVEQFRINNPQVIVSYVAPLYEVAKYINANNINLRVPQTILTGAEPLLDFQRKTIEKAFGCNVHNTFGCREFMLMASECHQQKNLHINSDHLVVETLDDQKNTISGLPGDLVITDLYNYGMPLIRYVNGDRATLTDRPCSCGNQFPLIQQIDGRKPDVIKTPSGGIINGVFFPHLFKEFKNIKRFQVIQKKLTEINIKLIVDDVECFKKEKDKIDTEINKYTHNELLLNFDLVETIALTPSGKHRVTICEV